MRCRPSSGSGTWSCDRDHSGGIRARDPPGPIDEDQLERHPCPEQGRQDVKGSGLKVATMTRASAPRTADRGELRGAMLGLRGSFRGMCCAADSEQSSLNRGPRHQRQPTRFRDLFVTIDRTSRLCAQYEKKEARRRSRRARPMPANCLLLQSDIRCKSPCTSVRHCRRFRRMFRRSPASSRSGSLCNRLCHGNRPLPGG